MDATPVFILQPTGDVASPAQSSDVQAFQTALLAAIGTPLHPNTKITSVTVSLAAAVVDQLVSLGTLTTVETVVVKNLAGTTATLKFGAATEQPIPLLQGEVRNNLAVGALYLNSPGAAGGTITLELQGR
ncbi:MAG TPA: hypothetical protein VF768_04215 [Holophagaceae bacterium]